MHAERGRLARFAGAREIIRRRAQDPIERHDFFLSHRRTAHGRKAQDDIEIAFGEIIRTAIRRILQHQRDAQARLRLGKTDNGVRQMHGAERFRRQNFQRTGRLRMRAQNGALVGLDLAKHPLAEFEIGGAFFGQRQRSSRAVQQAHAKMRLQVADVPRHQSARQAELAGANGEAAGPHHPHETFHGPEAVQTAFLLLCNLHQ